MDSNKGSKRLVKTRQEFKELSKSGVKKWKTMKALNERKTLEEKQFKEIEKINKQLIALRHEYKTITQEKGLAHKWAQLVAKHEEEVNEFEKRRHKEVLKKSINTFNDFVNENIEKQNNIEFEKQKQMFRRKQLMKSSLHKQNVDKEDIDILRQLQTLQKSEDILKEVIEKRTQISRSEESLERSAERLFWPKVLVPKERAFELNASDIAFNNTPSDRGVRQHKNASAGDRAIGTQTSHLAQNDVINEFKSKSETKETKESIDLRTDVKSVESVDSLPISIATKLYERLKTHKMTNSGQQMNKIYRNVAINTTIPSKSTTSSAENINDFDGLDQSSIISSLQTSYLSVPTTPQMATNRATVAFNRLLNKKSNSVLDSEWDWDWDSLHDITVGNDSSDPLIARINKLKKLIETKVGRKDESVEERDVVLSAGDSKLLVSKSVEQEVNQKINSFEQKSENKNEFQNHLIEDNFEAIDDLSSNSSATSFKTLQAISSSGRSSPLSELSIQLSNNGNRDLSSFQLINDSNVHSLELMSNGSQSISSSFIGSEPLRDRKAFWKEVFERAGIEVNSNLIDNYFPNNSSITEPIVDSFSSFTLKSFSTDFNSHSTPKR